MGTWNTAPQVSKVPTIPHNANADPLVTELYKYIKEMANVMTAMKNDLEFMVNGHLDVANIRAEGIETKNLKAEAITTDKIQAGAVIAEKIDVKQLSAISADMGKITAGEVYGAYIATRENSYPRAELNSTSDLIGAYASASNNIQVYTPSSGFSPTIRFQTPAGVAYITYNIDDNNISVTSNDANINISTQKKIELFANGGVYLPGWSFLKHNGTGRSLEDDFVKK